MLSEEALALFWVVRNSCITKHGDCYVCYPAGAPAGAQTQLFYPQAAQIIARCVPFCRVYIKTMRFFGRSILSCTNICLCALDFLLQLVRGQMKPLNTDACTQMNSWLQASSLHSFHCLWLGDVWTLQKKEVGVLFLLCMNQSLRKKKTKWLQYPARIKKRWPFLTHKYQPAELPWEKRLYHSKKQRDM